MYNKNRQLNGNQLTGTIPTQFSKFTSLQELFFFFFFFFFFFEKQLHFIISFIIVPSKIINFPEQFPISFPLYHQILCKNYFVLAVKKIQYFFFYFLRKLSSNYWNCPIPSYSSRPNNDYSNAKGQCGKNKLWLSKNKIK